jgi:hypothetical protein
MAKHKAKQRKTKAIAKAEQANHAAVKTYTGGGYGYIGFNGSPSREYRADEYSVSQAYTFNVAINRAVEFWQLWLDGLEWEIRSISDDKVLIRSDKRNIAEGMGSKLAKAIKGHKRRTKHSYFSSVAFSDTLYGESYTHLAPNEFGFPQDLEWLNPLSVEPDIQRGKIEGYRISADEGYVYRRKEQVAYHIAKRDAGNDLRGLSRVIAVIDELNIEAAEKQSLKNYFKNNMQLGGVISPREASTNLSPAQIQQMEDKFSRDNKGSVNAGRWAIAPTDMNITPFPAVDIEKSYTINEPLKNAILMAMGAYPQLVGDPSAADYDSAYDIKRQWWELLGIPYAHDIEDYINDQVLPFLDPHALYYFVFNLTPYEVEKPEVVAQDFNAGFIDMLKAATLRGYEGNPKLKGIHIINGMPMHEDIIVRLAHSVPSQYQLDMAQASEATAQADAVISTPTLPPSDGHETLPDGWTEEHAVGNEAEIEAALNTETLHHKAHSHDLLPNVIDYSDIDPLEELKAWRRFLTNGKSAKRPFEAKALRGDLADAIQLAVDSQDKQTLLDAFRHAQERIETRVKAIQATRLDFENSVADIMSLALASNNYGRQQWSSAMRKIIRSACTRAYVDGLVNGGVLDGKLSEDDQDTLASHIATQSQYVTNLGEEIFKTEAGISEAMADRKPTLWFNKSVMPMFDAGQLSANGNRMMEFAGDDGEENCPTCKRLKGQRHRHKDWARKGLRPDAVEDSDNFDCGLWECKHHLIPVSAGERGNYLN